MNYVATRIDLELDFLQFQSETTQLRFAIQIPEKSLQVLTQQILLELWKIIYLSLTTSQPLVGT